ncbi:MAG: FecR domain-containing protein [Bacteroidales bacterium]|nr:FecR domain-containing protein [Bacteroidales bacterium]
MSSEKRWKPDVDRAWEKFCAHVYVEGLVEQKKTVARKRSLSPPFGIWSAAAVLCAICVGVAIHFWSKSSSVEMIVAQNNKENETLVITLPDGSVALLSGNGKLTYPQSFASNRRLVTLEGEAFFDVSNHDRCPFVIEADRVTVEVLGTSFRMRSDETCPFELFVKSGIVKVVLMDVDQNIFAEAGEQVQLVTNWLQKSYVDDMDAQGSGIRRLYFKDEPLGQIIRVVNAYTLEPFQLSIEDESLLGRDFTVTLDMESVEGIAELLCSVLNLKQTVVENIIYIDAK